jgi:hypothetical protein
VQIDNTWQEWPPQRNSSPPPGITEPIQRELDAIAGLAPGGYSRLKLFWGQSMRERDRYPGAPDFSSADFMEHRYSENILNLGWVAHFPDGDLTYPPSVDPPQELLDAAAKYDHIIDMEEKTETMDIGIPRWYIHQWRPHTAVDAATYEADRAAYDVEANHLLTFAPAVMPAGQWAQVVHIVISEHAGGCCAKAKSLGVKCFANYRDPEQVDLDYIAAIWKEKQQQPVRFAEGEICPPWIIEQRTKARLDEISDHKRREAARRRIWLRSMFKDNQHRIFSNPRSGYNTVTGNSILTGRNVR